VTHGVILYGPPAAGKDTITAHMHTLNPVYVLFPRLKAGAGRTIGYRMTTPEALDQLVAQGAIVWENARYDARYAIDLPELRARLRQHVPVLHLGQVPAVDAVKAATPGTRWFVVTVWCPREEAARRAEARGTGDVAERLRAWDETQPLAVSDLVVDTAQTPPSACARTIDQRARDGGVGTLPPAAGSADAG
jgi:guanylate kinase